MALSKEVVNLGMPGRSLLVRALQQLTDRELVLERVGTLEAVLLRQSCFDEVARGLDFGFPADDVLAAIDGQRTVREICDASGLDDFQVCKVLYTLMLLGAVDHELRPARELIFVEGELENGEEIPRVDDGTKARRSWLRSARASTHPAQPTAPATPASAPPPVRQEPEAVAAAPPASDAAIEPETSTEETAETGTKETPAPTPAEVQPAQAAVRRRRPGRTALWAASLAVPLLAIGASLYYATYVRPTLDSDDAEEARLMAALVEELEESGEIDAPEDASQAAVVPGIPDAGGVPSPGAEPPPSGEAGGEARPVLTEPKPDPRPGPGEASGGPQAPLSQPPRREAPALENRALFTMLSRDGNFREALNLVRKRRLRQAAESFQRALAAQPAGSHTIQLLLACQGSTVEKAFERTPDRTLYFVTTTFRGQTCYRLFDGLYASAAEARTHLSRVPAIFREDGNRPGIVRVPRR
jgi:hypothetical protein